MIAGDDIAPGGKRADRRANVGGGVDALEGGGDFVLRAPAVEQRQQIAIEPAMQQGIERLGNQKRLLFPDFVDLQVGGKRGKPDGAPVRRSRSG